MGGVKSVCGGNIHKIGMAQCFPYLLIPFHQSLKEGHDQEDNVSTDGGVTSDVE